MIWCEMYCTVQCFCQLFRASSVTYCSYNLAWSTFLRRHLQSFLSRKKLFASSISLGEMGGNPVSHPPPPPHTHAGEDGTQSFDPGCLPTPSLNNSPQGFQAPTNHSVRLQPWPLSGHPNFNYTQPTTKTLPLPHCRTVLIPKVEGCLQASINKTHIIFIIYSMSKESIRGIL